LAFKKSKASKLLVVSSAVFASSIVTANPQGAEASSNVESLVKNAENLANALKWEISYEHRKIAYPKTVIDYPNMKLFNEAKAAMIQAENALKNATGTQKEALKARLDQNVKSHYDRAVRFIDAVTAGKRIQEKSEALQEKLSKNIIDDSTEKAYHALSREIKERSPIMNKAYGKSTRDAFVDKFNVPANKTKETALYPVSIKIEIDRLNKALVDKDKEKALYHANRLEKFFEEGLKGGHLVEKSELYNKLSEVYKVSHNNYTNLVQGTTPGSGSGSGSGGGSEVTPPAASIPVVSGIEIIDAKIMINDACVNIRFSGELTANGKSIENKVKYYSVTKSDSPIDIKKVNNGELKKYSSDPRLNMTFSVPENTSKVITVVVYDENKKPIGYYSHTGKFTKIVPTKAKDFKKNDSTDYKITELEGSGFILFDFEEIYKPIPEITKYVIAEKSEFGNPESFTVDEVLKGSYYLFEKNWGTYVKKSDDLIVIFFNDDYQALQYMEIAGQDVEAPTDPVEIATNAVNTYESAINSVDKVKALVNDGSKLQSLLSSYTPANNAILKVSDKEKANELRTRLDKAHNIATAADFVNGLQKAVIRLTSENLSQVERKLTSATGNVSSLPESAIKDALMELIGIEKGKINDFKDDVEAGVVFVSSQTDLEDALNNEAVTHIKLANDIKINSQLIVKHTNKVIDGAGYTISANAETPFIYSEPNKSVLTILGVDNVSISNLIIDAKDINEENKWNGIYTVQVYNSNAAKLDNVTLKNGDAGLLVNGSIVTANNIQTLGNEFGGIEVSKGAGELKNSKLTVTGISTHQDKLGTPAIWVYPEQELVDSDQYVVTDENQGNNNNQTYYDLTEKGNALIAARDAIDELPELAEMTNDHEAVVEATKLKANEARDLRVTDKQIGIDRIKKLDRAIEFFAPVSATLAGGGVFDFDGNNTFTVTATSKIGSKGVEGVHYTVQEWASSPLFTYTTDGAFYAISLTNGDGEAVEFATVFDEFSLRTGNSENSQKYSQLSTGRTGGDFGVAGVTHKGTAIYADGTNEKGTLYYGTHSNIAGVNFIKGDFASISMVGTLLDAALEGDYTITVTMYGPIRSGVMEGNEFIKHTKKAELTVLDSIEYKFTVGESQVVMNLAAAVDEVDSLVENDYTAETWEALKLALAMAEASDEEKIAKTAAINKAIADLIKASEPTEELTMLPEGGYTVGE